MTSEREQDSSSRSPRPVRILILEDRESDAELVVARLRAAGIEPDWTRVDSEAGFRAELGGSYEVALADFSMPGFDATRAMEIIRDEGASLPLIVVSGSISEEVAVEAMRDGAADYLLKDRLGRLGAAVLRVLEERELAEQRRQLEAQLVQAQKMEAVGQLAGGIAHDFNNILTAVSGYADLLRGGMEPDDPRRAEATAIVDAAERAAALIRQLLAFSRQQVQKPEVLDLNEVVDGIAPLVRRLIGEDIAIDWRPAPDLRATVADRAQLEQVVVNLAVNARDAMPDGGRLTIETANVELDDQYARSHASVIPGRYVMLAVSDTGVGMDETTRARIFEPFFTTKEPGRGTGLGLAMVYGIVKQTGGDVWVYSEPGRGSTFKLYFPPATAPLAEAEPAMPEPEATEGRGETILVAEDDDSVRALLQVLLERLGYRVRIADDGASALRAATSGEIDLLITDVVMPGVSGLEVAAELRARRPEVAILLISGYTARAIVPESLRPSEIALLEKPFTPDGLARAVRQALDRARLEMTRRY